ncbi:MAG: DUF5682 family protein [Janthinobacterium lividum]
MSTRVLGVRHHGPGSARSVRAALEEFAPTVVLVEGPADADPLIPFVAEEDMRPPVALLAHLTDPHRAGPHPGDPHPVDPHPVDPHPVDPGTVNGETADADADAVAVVGNQETSIFWPFAVFSPEWQALTWATSRGVPVRFMDLPAAQLLAPREPDTAESAARPLDPIATLARTAGYDDPERWWEDLVEHRPSLPRAGHHADGREDGREDARDDRRAAGGDVFDALIEAMAALRVDAPEDPHEQRREAHMRSVLRRALREGHERIAVVCGAWHAPALTGKLPSAASDAALLKGAAKVRATLSWVPWTHGRLAGSSGYGAGIESPGWYHHLFTAPDLPVTRWLTAVARVLRADDLPVSSASVIEAVRLADTLATVRGRPLAGLDEVTEATRAVLCQGDDVLLGVVTRRLVVGELFGEVPAAAPTLPLAADLQSRQRALRLKPDAAVRDLALDLRLPRDRDRSVLLHRLTLLGIDWGVPVGSSVRSTGTFRETWQLVWRPELSVDVVLASRWGTTIAGAAAGRLAETADGGNLAQVTEAVEQCLVADLPAALAGLLTALDARAAHEADVAHLMAALPALVRASRYGDVRGTDTAMLAGVVAALLVRVTAGLPAAVGALDDGAAVTMRGRIDDTSASVDLLGDAQESARWRAALLSVADRDGVHPLLQGRITRLLRDAGTFDATQAGTRTARALSAAEPAGSKGSWLEGFLSGGGLLLVHDSGLLGLLDSWIAGLSPEEFLDALPLVRRTFSTFEVGERRQLGAAVAGVARGANLSGAEDVVVDVERARRALGHVARLLGVS